jgi:LysR family pca operon transcriptional activator
MPIAQSIRVERIKVRHLNCLLALAEHGSSVRAAQALSVTQPAVSKTLAEFEEIVGQRLCVRTRKGVNLTAAGRVLLRYASRSLQVLGEGVEKIADMREVDEPVLSIGALPTAAAALLPRALLLFEATHTPAQIRVRTGSNTQLIASLRKGETDLVLGRLTEPAEMTGLVFEHLYSEPLVFAVRPSHPLLRRKAIDPSAMLSFRILLPDAGTSVRAAADQYFVSVGVGMPENTIQSIDVNFCRSYTLSSNAIWCTPVGVVELDLKKGLLVHLAIEAPLTRGPVGLTLRAEQPTNEALVRLIEQIRAAALEYGAEAHPA